MKNRIVQWAADNRVIISAISVVGSFAGLIFAGLDLQTSIQERQRKAALGKRKQLSTKKQ